MRNVFRCTLSCPPLPFPPSLSHTSCVISCSPPRLPLCHSVTLHLVTSTLTLWPPTEKWEKLSCLAAAVFFSIHLNLLHLPPALSFDVSVFFSLTHIIFLSLLRLQPLALFSLCFIWHFTLTLALRFLCFCVCLRRVKTEHSVDSLEQWHWFIFCHRPLFCTQ